MSSSWQQESARLLGRPIKWADEFADGTLGPALALIPAGRFVMGSPDGSAPMGEVKTSGGYARKPYSEPERERNETPHLVTLATPFGLGVTAVRFVHYDAFCAATGRALPEDEGWGRGDRPAINVSGLDAMAYCDWLTAQTGHRYRLPTEAEWEYACRAGTTTAFWWGNGITTDQANYNGSFGYDGGPTGAERECTLPVMTFAPNPWGLYQMHGNILEWCSSAFAKHYDGRETVPVAHDDPSERVLRGGSWNTYASDLRSACREYHHEPDYATDQLGFRVLRELP